MGISLKDRRIRKDTHPFTNLFIILVVVTILANFIPSGTYERVVVDGRSVVDPATFTYAAEKSLVGISTFFLSFFNGFKDASSLMAMLFFAGGAFGVATRIGLMETTLKTLARKLQHTSFAVIAFVLMAAWGTLVAFTSMWELSIVVIPIVVPLALSLGYDVVTGAGIVILASCAGFGSALSNPLFTAIAHKLAELPIYSAMWYRAISFVVILLVEYAFLMLYARRIKKDPSKILVKTEETGHKAYSADEANFTPALVRAGIAFIVVFSFVIYGTINMGFDFPEMAASFAALGIIVGLAYGLTINDIMDMMGEGMKDMFYGAMVMLFARAVLYVMTEAAIIDTVIHFLSQFVVGKSPIVTGNLLLWMQTIINFFVPSGSGQAAITVPILIPLADMGNVTRQVCCLASQFGDGFSNFIYPTNGTLLGILLAAGIPYKKWLKFFGPLFVIIMALSMVFVSVGVVIGLGPF